MAGGEDEPGSGRRPNGADGGQACDSPTACAGLAASVALGVEHRRRERAETEAGCGGQLWLPSQLPLPRLIREDEVDWFTGLRQEWRSETCEVGVAQTVRS